MKSSRFNVFSVAAIRGRGVVMTYDITLEKVSTRPRSSRQRAGWGYFPLSLLLLFKCHKMSQRQTPLQQGVFSVTLLFPLLSFVTPNVGQCFQPVFPAPFSFSSFPFQVSHF